MSVISSRRVAEFSRMACAVIAIGGCATFARGSGPESFPLVVNNHSDFEVVVYAMPSSASSGVRLGNARSFSTTTMRIPRNVLQSADVLVLKLHSIGSPAASWITPATTLDSGVVAQLDIRADPSGYLSRSSLYTDVASTGRHP